jgi:hypothetical protein
VKIIVLESERIRQVYKVYQFALNMDIVYDCAHSELFCNESYKFK